MTSTCSCAPAVAEATPLAPAGRCKPSRWAGVRATATEPGVGAASTAAAPAIGSGDLAATPITVRVGGTTGLRTGPAAKMACEIELESAGSGSGSGPRNPELGLPRGFSEMAGSTEISTQLAGSVGGTADTSDVSIVGRAPPTALLLRLLGSIRPVKGDTKRATATTFGFILGMG